MRNTGTVMILERFCPLVFSLLCVLMLSCQKSEDDILLEQALEMAGSNRTELQKVLGHYADDSLKLEAAKFLIRYMPGHYSYVDTAAIKSYGLAVASALDSLKNEENLKVIQDSINQIAHVMGIDTLSKVQDCQIMSADYLIRNIDIAFHDWQEGPWAKHICFDDFCEWILPYKVEDLQPLDDWRSRLKNFHVGNMYDLAYCDQLRNSPMAAAIILNRNLANALHPRSTISIQCPHMPLEIRARIPFGTCTEYSNMTATIFRCHGIPIAVDFTPQWAKRSMGHSWNVVNSETGEKEPFGGISTKIEEKQLMVEVRPKVFRRTYSWNQELVDLNNSGEDVPSLFQDIFFRDVTKEIIQCSDVTLEVNETKCKYAYLLVFDNQNWVPVAFGKIMGRKVTFKDMGQNIVYLPAVYTDGQVKPISDPFILEYDGTIKKIVADTQKKHDLVLDRKYPVKEYFYQYIPRLKDGEFQGSNDPEFKEFYVAHHIKDGTPSGQYVTVSDTIPPCRYWRYTSENGRSFCNIAEVMFFAKGEKEKLQGAVIGTEGSWGNNPNRTKETVYDGDVLTSFDAPQGKGCWAGLDMGKPVKVDHIIYYGRGDGNGIEIGDEYELLYWDNGWKSMGRQKAKNVYVKYTNVPQNALYHLRNHTKGTDERIFTFENGKQVWW